MPLMRSADSSTSCSEPGCYGRKSCESSGLSSQIYSADKQMLHYGLNSYQSDIYGQQYFTNSSTGLNFLNSIHLSSSSGHGTMHRPQGSSGPYQLIGNTRSSVTQENPYSACFAAVRHQVSSISTNQQTAHSLSESQSLDPEMDYDEIDIRLKLQELERALLSENDEDVDLGQEMLIDEDWTESIKSLMTPNSPKESSSDSNISSISSSRETRTPKQLLFDCAAVISDGNVEEAQAMISELRQMVAIQGDPSQRLAAYLVEGLAARIASSGHGLYKALKCKEPPTTDRLSAMQILFEICPCFKFGFMAANGAIAEAFKDEERVHILDFDINQGSQYITLIQALSARQTKPPHLRITGVDDPESVQRAIGGLKIIGQRLEKLAEEVGVPFEFRAIAAKTADVTPSMLDCQPGEALVVNFAFQLHHMPDESVSTVNQRDRLLRMVKSLDPKLVTVVEQDVNTNTAPFFPRFVEVYNYYSAVFESLDATLPRESPDRMNVERQCLARDIVNIVACEGADRIERYEAAGKWRARMTMAGFVSCPLSSYVNGAIRSLLKSYCDRYKIKEENGALYFGWEDKILVVASAWK
uniref:Scarecrow-like protein 1-like isoform X1 n=1 Tax=Cymbidium sinense TaxID=112615 RepID=A0A515HGG5_9ASPA|nr:scarecrow-like protein 1-like isoform X1 [Cymbidium sinense]QDL88522.1 scarecrow-like protein 1-like isoform X2 [Cymbidium sinense]